MTNQYKRPTYDRNTYGRKTIKDDSKFMKTVFRGEHPENKKEK